MPADTETVDPTSAHLPADAHPRSPQDTTTGASPPEAPLPNGHAPGDGVPRRPPATPPVVLVTWAISLTHRVEHLARSVGVPILTLAELTHPLRPPPALLLVGAESLDDVLHAGALGPPDADDAGRVVLATSPPTIATSERAAHFGAEALAILPDDETWLVSRMLTAALGPLAVGGRVVGVTGGRGGAGASVLAAALARTAAERLRCVLVDADPLGGGSDLLLGAEDDPGLRWADLENARGLLDPDVLDGLPRIDGVRVVTWDRSAARPVPPEAMRAVVDAAVRVADLVVVDLPRSLDQAATLALQACHTVLLVVSADVQASAAAQRSAAVLRRWAEDIRVVVRGPAPGGLEPERVARALDLPLAGWLRPERRLAAALERAEPPALRRRGPLAAFCRDLLADLTTPRPGPRRLGLARRARER